NYPGSYPVLARLSTGYPGLQGRLPTCYSPVRRFTSRIATTFSHDLHVSGTPPAFVLSQDQTLHYSSVYPPSETRLTRHGNGRTDRILNQRNRSGIESIPGPPPPIKACTTIQFSKTSPFGAKGNSTARSKPMSIGLLRISGEVSRGSAQTRRRPEILEVAPSDVKSSGEQISVGHRFHRHLSALPPSTPAFLAYPVILQSGAISTHSVEWPWSGPREFIASQSRFVGNFARGKLRCDDYLAWPPSDSVFITSGTTPTRPSNW